MQQYGLKLRFVDIDINTLNVSVENIIKAYTKKTKLIVAVSILGNPVHLSKLKAFCKSKNIYLMEDNCESMGAKINGKYSGTFGIVNTFSTFFHLFNYRGGLLQRMIMKYTIYFYLLITWLDKRFSIFI